MDGKQRSVAIDRSVVLRCMVVMAAELTPRSVLIAIRVANGMYGAGGSGGSSGSGGGNDVSRWCDISVAVLPYAYILWAIYFWNIVI